MLDKNLERIASDKLALERVLKARTELILSHRFYGVLVTNVDVVMTRSIPTAATNGTTHYWNPDFVHRLSQEELVTVQMHESEHDARHHGTRRGDRGPLPWNHATDYAINIDLVDQGRKFPSAEVLGGDPLIDPKYRGMSAEDIYRCRELDEAKAKKEQEEKERQEREQADSDPDAGAEAGDDEQEPEGEPEGKPEGDDGDETGGDDGEGNGEPTGEPEADGQGEGRGGAPEASQDGPEGQGGGGTGGNEPTEAANTPANGGGGGEPTDEQGDGDEPVSTGDFAGSLGEVLDSAETAGELSDDDTRWERVVRQAASLAKARGELPGHVTREIDRANNPPQDWREVLRAFIDGGSKRIETWNRPNRRFAGQGIILPGSQRDGLNRVVACIDTSGSMDDVALACVQTEMRAAFDEGAIDELVVIYGDTRVTRVDTYYAGDEIEFDPRGGGGTDLKPMFQYVAENIEDPSLMIVFTDLEIGDPGPAPECPALFAVTGYPDKVRALLAHSVPWDAVGIDVGAH